MTPAEIRTKTIACSAAMMFGFTIMFSLFLRTLLALLLWDTTWLTLPTPGMYPMAAISALWSVLTYRKETH